jgi:hypothetical protein
MSSAVGASAETLELVETSSLFADTTADETSAEALSALADPDTADVLHAPSVNAKLALTRAAANPVQRPLG